MMMLIKYLVIHLTLHNMDNISDEHSCILLDKSVCVFNGLIYQRINT